MTEENALYKAALKAWLMTQKNNIASCVLNIKHAEEQIALLQKKIELEKAEKLAKEAQLAKAAKDYDAIV